MVNAVDLSFFASKLLGKRNKNERVVGTPCGSPRQGPGEKLSVTQMTRLDTPLCVRSAHQDVATPLLSIESITVYAYSFQT